MYRAVATNRSGGSNYQRLGHLPASLGHGLTRFRVQSAAGRQCESWQAHSAPSFRSAACETDEAPVDWRPHAARSDSEARECLPCDCWMRERWIGEEQEV